MRNVFHLSQRGVARSISEQDGDVQLSPQSEKADARVDIASFNSLVRDVCPSAPFDIALSIDKSLPQRVRRSRYSDEVEAIARDVRGTGAKVGLESIAVGDGASPAERAKPAILLIHPRAVFRDCFAKCLEIAYEDHIVCSFKSVVDWRSSGEGPAWTPAVAIIVVESGDSSGSAQLELLEDVTEEFPVIVVSDIDDGDHIVRTLKRGARGYIPSNLPFNIAVEAVRLVEAGGVFVPASSFVDRDEPSVPARSGVKLTERQMAVIDEIRRGKANKQIAYELNMSEHTVKVHLRHIMRKLKARNRTEVAVLCESGFGNSKG